MDFFFAGRRKNFQSVRQAESCGINDKNGSMGGASYLIKF